MTNDPGIEQRQPAERRAARWSAGLAVATILTFLALVVLGYLDVRVVSLILVFFASGIATLVVSAYAVVTGERSALVWASFVAGLLATALIVAEFTVLE